MNKTLDQLCDEYDLPIDKHIVLVNKWKEAAWEIHNVYNLERLEEISQSRARELTRAIIEKYAALQPPSPTP